MSCSCRSLSSSAAWTGPSLVLSSCCGCLCSGSLSPVGLVLMKRVADMKIATKIRMGKGHESPCL